MSLVALVRAFRPLQWVKNGLVFLPFVFAVDVAWSTDDLSQVPDLLVKLFLIASEFCALSSGVYLFNDLLDRAGDQLHPIKRNRPIASGMVGAPLAVSVMIILAVVALAVMVLVEPLLATAGGLYALINIGYSLGLKQVGLLDAFAVTSGYVIRAVAGFQIQCRHGGRVWPLCVGTVHQEKQDGQSLHAFFHHLRSFR